MVISMSMTEASIEAGLTMALNLEAPTFDKSTLFFEQVSYIYHSVQFKKNQAKVQALLNFDNEVNIMILAYITRLGFKVRLTNVRA